MESLQQLLNSVTKLSNQSEVMSIVSTLLLIVGALIIRWVLARSLRNNDNLPNDIRRRGLVLLRNATFFLILLGLVVIWAEELRLFAVSLLAVAVAMVIAAKELIQCISGSVMKVASRSFTIGDRIEVSNLRGDVIDANALTTTILEIGPNQLTQQLTGRAIVIPNCMFLNTPVINETFTEEFVLHVFRVPVDDEVWEAAESDLLAAATEACEPHLEEARRHFSKLKEHDGLFTMPIEPRITYAIPKAGELELVVRIPVPARRKGRVEQAILRRYLVAATERKLAKKKNETENAAAANKTDDAKVSDSKTESK